MGNKKQIISVVLSIVVLVLIIILARNGKSNVATPNDTTMNQTDGLKIEVKNEGAGEMAKNGDVVGVNYTGMLTDGTVFDSSVDPKFGHVEPIQFQLGGGMVIQGWEKGVLGMKVGEKRHLTISPELAYGDRGAGGVIPPNATLEFDVELVSINK